MIEFENVSKSFWTGKSRKVILDQANFKVQLGSSLGVLAPNGTGKTTIINMMAGLEQPDEGRILRTSKVSFPLGTVSGVNKRHSAQENARYIARLYSLDPDYTESFCRYLCDIKEYFEMPVATYSAGMKSRFMFALMLSLEFDIYLIDEGMPSTFDEGFNQRAGQILDQRLSAATVVIVSHRANTLKRYCSTGAVLKNGRLTFYKTLDEAQEVYKTAA